MTTRNANHEKAAILIHYHHQNIRRTPLSIRSSRLDIRNTDTANSSRVVASRPITSDTLDKGRHLHDNSVHHKRSRIFHMETNERIPLTFFLTQNIHKSCLRPDPQLMHALFQQQLEQMPYMKQYCRKRV